MEYAQEKQYEQPKLNRKPLQDTTAVSHFQAPLRSFYSPDSQGVIQRKIKIINTVYGSGWGENDLDTLIERMNQNLRKDIQPGDPIYNSIQNEWNASGTTRYRSYKDLYNAHARQNLPPVPQGPHQQSLPKPIPRDAPFPPPQPVLKPDQDSHWDLLRCVSPLVDEYGATKSRTTDTTKSTMFSSKIQTTVSGAGRFSMVGGDSTYSAMLSRQDPVSFGQSVYHTMSSGQESENPEANKLVRIVYNSEGFGRSMHTIPMTSIFFQNIERIRAAYPEQTFQQLVRSHLPFTREGGASLSRAHFVTPEELGLLETVLVNNGVDPTNQEAVERFLLDTTRSLIDISQIKFQ